MRCGNQTWSGGIASEIAERDFKGKKREGRTSNKKKGWGTKGKKRLRANHFEHKTKPAKKKKAAHLDIWACFVEAPRGGEGWGPDFVG